MSKISVIIPVYNSADYLEKCLDSILNQDLKDIEVICTDDGSSDNSLDIIESYAKKDERVMVLSQNHRGASYARNSSLALASGEYVHFVDSDDVLENNVYKKLYENAVGNNLDLIYFDAETIFDNPLLEEKFAHKKDVYKKKNEYPEIYRGIDFFCKMIINKEYTPVPWLYLVKKELLDNWNLRFKEDVLVHNDNPFSFMVITKSNRVQYYKKCCYNRRIRPDSLTTNQISYKNCLGSALSHYYIFNDLCDSDFYDDSKMVVAQYLTNTILKKIADDYWLLPDDQKELLERAVVDIEKKIYIYCFIIPYIHSNKRRKDSCCELETIKHSISYRLGMAITFVPRMARRIVKAALHTQSI